MSQNRPRGASRNDGNRLQSSVPPTPNKTTGVPSGSTGENKDQPNPHDPNNTNNPNTTLVDPNHGGDPSDRPRKHIYPFSPKKARRADVLTYPHPVIDYDVEQARQTPKIPPLIPNAWQLDFFRIFSIMVGILILLPTVFHTRRNDSYAGTAYASFQTVALVLQIIGGIILIVTIISVSFAPTVYTR